MLFKQWFIEEDIRVPEDKTQAFYALLNSPKTPEESKNDTLGSLTDEARFSFLKGLYNSAIFQTLSGSKQNQVKQMIDSKPLKITLGEILSAISL